MPPGHPCITTRKTQTGKTVPHLVQTLNPHYQPPVLSPLGEQLLGLTNYNNKRLLQDPAPPENASQGAAPAELTEHYCCCDEPIFPGWQLRCPDCNCPIHTWDGCPSQTVCTWTSAAAGTVPICTACGRRRKYSDVPGELNSRGNITLGYLEVD